MNLCPECGQPTPEPEVPAAEVETAIVSDSAVEIARIEADKEIQLAKIARSELGIDERAELESLRSEVATLRGLLEPPPPPEPEPVPIVVTEPEPEPEPGPDPELEPPITEPASAPRSGKRQSVWW